MKLRNKIILLCSFFIIITLIEQLKASFIVVQGSIQLWIVTIINNSGITLVVIDEVIDPQGSSAMEQILTPGVPNNQFSFQWPSDFQKPNGRRITIYGLINGVLQTNKIIIGNTADATHPMVPSGDFYIIRSSRRAICIADKLNPNQCAGR